MFKRLAERHPGVLSERELQRMEKELKGFSVSYSDGNRLPPVAVQFITQKFFNVFPASKLGEQRTHEIRTLCEAIDYFASGKIAQGMDILVGRLKSIQKTAKDGHSRVGRWFEVISAAADGTSISTEEEELALAVEASEVRNARALAAASSSSR